MGTSPISSKKSPPPNADQEQQASTASSAPAQFRLTDAAQYRECYDLVAPLTQSDLESTTRLKHGFCQLQQYTDRLIQKNGLSDNVALEEIFKAVDHIAGHENRLTALRSLGMRLMRAGTTHQLQSVTSRMENELLFFDDQLAPRETAQFNMDIATLYAAQGENEIAMQRYTRSLGAIAEHQRTNTQGINLFVLPRELLRLFKTLPEHIRHTHFDSELHLSTRNVLLQAVRSSATRFEAHLVLAEYASALGLHADALHEFDEALSYAQHPVERSRVIAVMDRLGNVDEAHALLNQAIDNISKLPRQEHNGEFISLVIDINDLVSPGEIQLAFFTKLDRVMRAASGDTTRPLTDNSRALLRDVLPSITKHVGTDHPLTHFINQLLQ